MRSILRMCFREKSYKVFTLSKPMSDIVTCDYCGKPITTRNDLTVGFFIIPLPFHGECFAQRTKSLPGIFLKNMPVNSWQFTIISVIVMFFVILVYSFAFVQYRQVWMLPLACIVVLFVSYSRWLSYLKYERKLPLLHSRRNAALLTSGWIKDNQLYCAFCVKQISNAEQLITARKLFGLTVFPLHNACFSTAVRMKTTPLLSGTVINSKEFRIRYMNTLGICAFFTVILILMAGLRIYRGGITSSILYLFLMIVLFTLIVLGSYYIRKQSNALVGHVTR